MELNEATHRENYERESSQKTLSARELHAKLAAIIAAGNGDRPVFLMEVDGLTHAVPIQDCFASEPYDGDLVWLIETEESGERRRALRAFRTVER